MKRVQGSYYMLSTQSSELLSFQQEPGLSRVMGRASPQLRLSLYRKPLFHISNHSHFQGRQVTRSAVQDVTERTEATKPTNEKADQQLQVIKQTQELLAALQGAWAGRSHPRPMRSLCSPTPLAKWGFILAVPEFPQTAAQRRTRFFTLLQVLLTV